MSKYLELKAQIEALTAQLEATRKEEFEAEVTDMKKRIVAFGIRPDDLFSKEDLVGRKPKRVREVKFSLNGHTWSGQGAMPNWYKAALASGHTPEQMAVAEGTSRTARR